MFGWVIQFLHSFDTNFEEVKEAYWLGPVFLSIHYKLHVYPFQAKTFFRGKHMVGGIVFHKHIFLVQRK